MEEKFVVRAQYLSGRDMHEKVYQLITESAEQALRIARKDPYEIIESLMMGNPGETFTCHIDSIRDSHHKFVYNNPLVEA